MNKRVIIIVIVIVVCVSISIGGGVGIYFATLPKPTTKRPTTTPTIDEDEEEEEEPEPTPRIYSVYKNTDYKDQGDISEKYNSNPEECKITCDNIPNCNGFTTNGSACFFKTKNINNPIVLNGYDYYYTQFTPPKPIETVAVFQKREYNITKNTDYKNQGDISEKYNTNPEECKTVCDNLPNCDGFVTNGSACFFKTQNVSNSSALQGYDYYKKV